METKALEREHLAKYRAEKYRVIVRIAKEKVHKYSIALITPWLMIGLYFVVTTVSGGNGHRQLVYHEFVYLHLKTYVCLIICYRTCFM